MESLKKDNAPTRLSSKVKISTNLNIGDPARSKSSTHIQIAEGVSDLSNLKP